jgi:putative hydrolase of the HAD superfamily
MMVFFDIDETLLDQRSAEAAAARAFLAVYATELAYPYSTAEFCAVWRWLREKHSPAFFAGTISAHEQRRRRVRELFARSGRSLCDAEADCRIELYESHYRSSWRLFEDVRPALTALGDYRCGVISNGSLLQQRHKLEQTSIASHFELVLVSEEIGAAKPAREIFLAACRRAGVNPSHCVYVGDRFDHDVLPSRAVGMQPYWICRRASSESTAEEVIGSLTDLAFRLRERSAA